MRCLLTPGLSGPQGYQRHVPRRGLTSVETGHPCRIYFLNLSRGSRRPQLRRSSVGHYGLCSLLRAIRSTAGVVYRVCGEWFCLLQPSACRLAATGTHTPTGTARCHQWLTVTASPQVCAGQYSFPMSPVYMMGFWRIPCGRGDIGRERNARRGLSRLLNRPLGGPMYGVPNGFQARPSRCEVGGEGTRKPSPWWCEVQVPECLRNVSLCAYAVGSACRSYGSFKRWCRSRQPIVHGGHLGTLAQAKLRGLGEEGASNSPCWASTCMC